MGKEPLYPHKPGSPRRTGKITGGTWVDLEGYKTVPVELYFPDVETYQEMTTIKKKLDGTTTTLFGQRCEIRKG